MLLYIQINNDTKEVIGYSTSKMHDEDIIVDSNNVENRFMNMPMFYNYKNKKIVFDEERYNNFLNKKKKNILTNEQKLGQQISDLEIQIMMLQQLLISNNKKEREIDG